MKKAASPSTRPVSPNTRRIPSTSEGPAEVALSLPELIYVLRSRAGFQSHDQLAIAAREYLPEGFSMNRRLVQALEHGDIPEGEVNHFALLAIALACGKTVEVFGLKPGEVEDVDRLHTLLKRNGWR